MIAEPTLPSVRRCRPWLGTLVEITASGLGKPRLDAALEKGFGAVAEVHRLMSFHDPGSDVSRLNDEAARRPVRVHPWTYEVLVLACSVAERSEGAFDPTVAPLLVRWGLLPSRFPATGKRVGCWSSIELLARQRVRFAEPLLLDLGGIAKGFAVDRAVEALEQAGVVSGLVNAGGDLRAFGPLAHAVGLRTPTGVGAVVELCDGALATSACDRSRRRVGARVRSALVEPRSRRAWLGRRSASVLAPTCALADALTKVVLFDRSLALRLLPELGARAVELIPIRRGSARRRALGAPG